MQYYCLQNFHFENFQNEIKLMYLNDLGGHYTTDTYFNIFNLELVEELCNFKTIVLKGDYQGDGDVELWGINHQNFDRQFISNLSSNNDTENKLNNKTFEYKIDLDYCSKNNISFLYIKYPKQLHLKKAGYYLETNEITQINIALITTTYNRENEIKALLTKFDSFLNSSFKKNTQLYNRDLISENTNISLSDFANIKLFIVNNGTDNLYKEISEYMNQNIEYIKSPLNCGGSGGFALGLEEVLKHNYTHYIFIDDDAMFYTESLFRTISLIAVLKEKYRNSVLSGSMFSKEDSYYCHCMQEGLRGNLHHRMLVGRFDISNEQNFFNALKNVNSNIKNVTIKTVKSKIFKENSPRLQKRISTTIPNLRTIYAAWWYACFPIEVAKEFGLPDKGFFFRGDDQEYALRINKKVICFNGICVWHPSFKVKANNFRTFLAMRNYILNCFLHSSSPLLLCTIFVIYKFYYAIKENDKMEIITRIYALKSVRCYLNEFINGQLFIKNFNDFVKKNECSSLLKLYILIFVTIFYFLLFCLFSKKNGLKKCKKKI